MAAVRRVVSHCLYFDPTDVRSARYNPLIEVLKGACEVRDVQNVADILVDPVHPFDLPQLLGSILG
ncbi:hypothetical protein [Sphingopyxis fribergensis]|uniref:hypothetical protein n=1 Tax=Sphingopyxis fribergensis TaxID=1515612 RepID=UPI0013924051|nr:hypothetical protein [Sphingopyxis fribergensis]